MELFPLLISVFFLISISSPGNAQDTIFIQQENLQGFEKESYRFELDNDFFWEKTVGLQADGHYKNILLLLKTGRTWKAHQIL